MAKINAINNESEELTIDPGASGDSFVQFDINGTGEFRIGVDDDASDAFKISQGSALGSNDTFIVTAAGEITKPLTPAFLAVLNADISNVTGDGTIYTIVWDTEVFDQNSDFDGTSTFTAPVTGRYQFSCGVSVGDVAAAHTLMYINLVTSNRTYLIGQCDPGNTMDASNQWGYSFSMLTDMDASDTATVQVVVQNSTKVIDVITNGSTDTYSWFSGNLEC